MKALMLMKPEFLADLLQEFGHVEVICNAPESVRLRVQMPADMEEGSAEWKQRSQRYASILKRHGVELVEKPVLRKGVTAIIVSGLVCGGTTDEH